jgi:hypothetical protein
MEAAKPGIEVIVTLSRENKEDILVREVARSSN